MGLKAGLSSSPGRAVESPQEGLLHHHGQHQKGPRVLRRGCSGEAGGVGTRWVHRCSGHILGSLCSLRPSASEPGLHRLPACLHSTSALPWPPPLWVSVIYYNGKTGRAERESLTPSVPQRWQTRQTASRATIISAEQSTGTGKGRQEGAN